MSLTEESRERIRTEDEYQRAEHEKLGINVDVSSGLKRSWTFALAERLGLPSDKHAILSIHLDPNSIVVLEAEKNEHGNKFVRTDGDGNRTLATLEHRFLYDPEDESA